MFADRRPSRIVEVARKHITKPAPKSTPPVNPGQRMCKKLCKVTGRVRESVLILDIPAIHAIHVVLAVVGVPTRLSKMKMTPAIHDFSIFSTFPLKF